MSKKEIELTNKQKYCQAQIDDLNKKLATLNFQRDQVNASLSVFKNAFIESAKEKADEVLNNPEEDQNDNT